MTVLENVPIAAQVQGDCAAAVCDSTGGTKQIYDSQDVAQKSGDCLTAVCVGVGQTTQQNDASDVPTSKECNVGVCAASGPAQQPVADGTPCSTGLCKVGTCVQHIPVCCVTSGQGSYCGCDGNPNPMPAIAIYWTDTDGVQHACNGSNSSKVDYCKPGTMCIASVYGSTYYGACK